ncbi:MAG TPA: hypothetical protein VMP86_00740 [Candidatus Binatia bacterium]|nr:hypothetical protein [Candidatus Binatia bacterium]
MTDNSGMPEPGASPTRAGVLYAVGAAVSAGLLLLLPVLMVGITMSVIASVMRGDIVAWVSGAGMTFVFVGIPALLSLFLLIIPYTLFWAAGRRVGTRRAIRWVGGLLVGWHAGVALLWARQATSGFRPATEVEAFWYAAAFGIVAVVILIATVVAEKRAVRAAFALVGALAVALVALVAVLVAVWGSPPRIPIGAQTVHIVVTASEVRLDPATVHAGEIYFVVEGADDPAGHAGFAFVQRQRTAAATPGPMSDEDVARLARGDYQWTATEGGWGNYARFTLHEGKYAFLTDGGGEPGVPPQSITVLEVAP